MTTVHSAKKLYDLELIVGSEYSLCPPWPRKVQKQESWLPLTKYSLSSDGQFHQFHHGTHLTAVPITNCQSLGGTDRLDCLVQYEAA